MLKLNRDSVNVRVNEKTTSDCTHSNERLTIQKEHTAHVEDRYVSPGAYSVISTQARARSHDENLSSALYVARLAIFHRFFRARAPAMILTSLNSKFIVRQLLIDYTTYMPDCYHLSY